jgi:signal transduction histidine kinase
VARAIALRHQLFIALVVPAVLVVFIIAYFADAAARRSLEAALGDRLSSVAEAASTIVGPQVLLLERGDDELRSAKNARAKLEALIAATNVERIFIVRTGLGPRPERAGGLVPPITREGWTKSALAILDSKGELKIGDEYTRARFDAAEIEQVEGGKSVASILFEGPDGHPYKTGYAPLRDENGQIAAYVGVNARASFYDSIRDLRTTMAVIAVFGFLLLVAFASLSARRVSVPLSRLSEAAQRIGEGKLDTEIPIGGATSPMEAEILAATMRSMARSLALRDEEMQLMLAGIAHEVRNPLGGIELFGGLLKEDLEATDPRRKHVDKILKELGTLSRVVNDFLDFARRSQLDPRTSDVHDLLAEVAALSERDASNIDVVLEVDAEKNLSAMLDPEAVKRAILNLVRNAIQASPKGGRVKLTGKKNGQSALVLEVSDQGPGIPPDKRKEIFTPFYTTKQKGTGLGLALVKKTVDAHRGRIHVTEAEGGGAKFVIELPEGTEAAQKP